MKRTWTIIAVADVAVSFRWYQSLLGLEPTAPAHDYFGQILDTDGTVLLCLHAWGEHDHPSLASPERSEPGHGLLLFLRVDDFDAALSRARALGACRTYGIESENATARGQIFDDSPVDIGSIGQESAEIWTAQTDLQPILHKSDRLLVPRFEQEPQLNPSTGSMEFSLRDLDGYFVTISALSVDTDT